MTDSLKLVRSKKSKSQYYIMNRDSLGGLGDAITLQNEEEVLIPPAKILPPNPYGLNRGFKGLYKASPRLLFEKKEGVTPAISK